MSNISEIPVNKYDLEKKISDISDISEMQINRSIHTRNNSFDNIDVFDNKLNETSKLDENEAKLLDNEVNLLGDEDNSTVSNRD